MFESGPIAASTTQGPVSPDASGAATFIPGRDSAQPLMLALRPKSNGMCTAWKKLHLDFRTKHARLRAVMDEDNAELITALCTQLGAIMEDASVVALTIGKLNGAGRTDALVELTKAAERIKNLIDAARALDAE